MITIEMLQQDETLKGLDKSIMEAIATLSKNDEQTVKDGLTRDLHNKYDEDIERIFGVKKGATEKSYVYLDRVGSAAMAKAKLGEEAEQLKATVTERDNTIKDLRDQIKKGSNNEALKTENDSLRQQLKDKGDEINTLKGDHQKAIGEWEQKYNGQRDKVVNNTFDRSIDQILASDDVNFNPKYDKTILQEILAKRRAEFRAKQNPGFTVIDEVDTFVLRDDNNEIIRNPKDGQKPMTPGLLFLTEIDDLLEKGRKQPGGKSKPDQQHRNTSTLDLSGVTKKQEAIVASIPLGSIGNGGIGKTALLT